MSVLDEEDKVMDQIGLDVHQVVQRLTALEKENIALKTDLGQVVQRLAALQKENINLKVDIGELDNKIDICTGKSIDELGMYIYKYVEEMLENSGWRHT